MMEGFGYQDKKKYVLMDRRDPEKALEQGRNLIQKPVHPPGCEGPPLQCPKESVEQFPCTHTVTAPRTSPGHQQRASPGTGLWNEVSAQTNSYKTSTCPAGPSEDSPRPFSCSSWELPLYCRGHGPGSPTYASPRTSVPGEGPAHSGRPAARFLSLSILGS